MALCEHVAAGEQDCRQRLILRRAAIVRRSSSVMIWAPRGSHLDTLQGAPVENRRRIVLDIVFWVFALFLAWIFVRQGIAKLSDASGWARAFRVWHFPVWFRVLIGVLEISAALLLLTRRTAFAGACIIIVVMLGAMGTHVYWGRPTQVTSEILPLVLATLVALGRHRVFFLRVPTAAAS